MPLDLERIEKKAISESVAEQLRLAILRGEVSVGERLPPERQLAPRFGTNRNTLREAIRSLEAQGLVVARQGDGVRVADFRRTGALSLVPDLLRVADPADRKLMFEDVLFMRRRMAAEVAYLAAQRAQPSDLEVLRGLLARQKQNDGDLLLTLMTDLEIYRALVDAAFSVIGQLLFASMKTLSQACIEQEPLFLYVPPDYLSNMTAVVDAIAEHRAEDARRTLETQLQKTDAILLERLGDFG